MVRQSDRQIDRVGGANKLAQQIIFYRKHERWPKFLQGLLKKAAGHSKIQDGCHFLCCNVTSQMLSNRPDQGGRGTWRCGSCCQNCKQDSADLNFCYQLGFTLSHNLSGLFMPFLIYSTAEERQEMSLRMWGAALPPELNDAPITCFLLIEYYLQSSPTEGSITLKQRSICCSTGYHGNPRRFNWDSLTH